MMATFLNIESYDGDFIFSNPDLSVGKDYIVFGFYFSVGGESYSPMTYIIVRDDDGRLIHAPIILFKINKGKIPSIWSFEVEKNGSIRVEPEEFKEDFFWDRVSDYESEAMETLRRIQLILHSEELL